MVPPTQSLSHYLWNMTPQVTGPILFYTFLTAVFSSLRLSLLTRPNGSDEPLIL